jgi:glycosyltransferase A (GT-A) superfamily protein (DUF2064 family)
VIAKAPQPGRSKTRLCPPYTPEQAAEVASAALADSLDCVGDIAARAGARPVLLVEGEPPVWTPPRFDVVVQRGDGLAERLANGFVDLGPGVIIGMETPGAAATLDQALRALTAGCDVMGLALDGGYWMIGLADADAARCAAVFDGIPMSASHTGLSQLRRLHSLGARVALLQRVRDLDDATDLAAAARTADGRLGELARSLLPVAAGG